MPAARSSEPKIYQLKIALERVSPPIWRRVLVLSTVPLSELHTVIQTAMGWGDEHLHSFSKGAVTYGEDGSGKSEADVRLNKVLTAEGQSLTYLYDFGDSWRHKVTLEKISPVEPGVKYPRLLDGKNRCPPEDCGGAGGYMRLLHILADPTHEEYEDWHDSDFDPKEFNLARFQWRFNGGEPQRPAGQTALDF